MPSSPTSISSDIKDRPSVVLAIGVFDGVHLGHQHLLEQVVDHARELDAVPVAMTFFPHPKEVILGLEGRLYVQSLEERVAHLGKLGMAHVITQRFDTDFRQVRARDFVEQIRSAVDLKALWGGKFSLGYEREGDYTFLAGLGEELGFTVHQSAHCETADGVRISSSRVRKALAEGDVGDAGVCLGRSFAVSGEVVLGHQRGRTIGFPTANVGVWERQIVPANGVYATRIQIGDTKYMAATNVGVRPTIEDDDALSVEAHILDFADDIYGETVCLEFVERVRDEQKFSGLDELKGQIGRDVEAVRGLLS